MTKEEITQAVISLVAEQYEMLNTDGLTGETHFVQDLGADSLDMVELASMLEDTFKLHIPDDTEDDFLAIKNVVAYLAEQLPATEPETATSP